MVEEEKMNEFSHNLFSQLMEIFIMPEVKRRQEIGELDKPLDLRAAQIIFFPDSRKPQVRVNSEIKAIAKAKLRPGTSKKPGDPIFNHEVEGLEEIGLTEKDDPDCAHATLLRIGDRWVISFDFRYNKALSKQHIETAKKFYESAKFSFDQENWEPFIDTLFSATELTAKSILLSIYDPKLCKKATHKGIQVKYNRFADLGSVKPDYRQILNKLSGLRGNARYLKGEISISKRDAKESLDTVKSMIEYVSRRIGIS